MDKGNGPEQENYDFLQEVIKEEKPSLGKILLKICRFFAIGLLVGAAVCIGFFALKPWAEKTFLSSTGKVEISEEEGEQPEVIIQKEETPVEILHNVTDYRELQNALMGVIKAAQKKVVYVKGIEQGQNWNDAKVKESTGVIVGDNGRELLILSTYSNMKDMQFYRVEFTDGESHEAVLKQKDASNNLAVFSVAKGDMSNTTKEAVAVASLANTSLMNQGELLFAIGSPFGYKNSVATGMVSSVKERILRADSECKMIISDIVGNTKSNAILFNTYGNVVGVVDTSLVKEQSGTPLTVVGISQIKKEIEMMSNGKNVPYIGIIGEIITEEVAEAENVPQGLFVKEVEVDSPAMAAGIQRGDILTEIDGEEIKSLNIYHNAVMSQEAGQSVRVNGQRSGVESYVDIKFNVTVGVK
jgi:serine protease Do